MVMLLLTRMSQDKIFVEHKGETLEITIARISRGQVAIGFDGAKSFIIKRDNIISHDKKTKQIK